MDEETTKLVELTRQEYRELLARRWDREHKRWIVTLVLAVFVLALGLPVAVRALDLVVWASGVVLIVVVGLPLVVLLRGFARRDRETKAAAAAFFEAGDA